MKSKLLWGFIIALIAIRMALPAILLPQINHFLKDFSALYVLHIEDFGLSIYRGAYRFEGLTAVAKNQTDPFLKVGLIDVSLPWRELFHGRLLADVVADDATFILTQEFLAKSKEQPKEKTLEEGKQIKSKLIPFNLARLDIRNSDFRFADVKALPPELQLHISGLEGRINNVTPLPADPISLFVAKGSLLDSGIIKIVGELNQLQKPLDWNLDIEIKDFELTKLNPVLKRKGPLTFKNGTLEAYSEVKSENGKIEGYVKPFLKKATFIGDKDDFKGLVHFGLEITTAALNALLKSSQDKSVATKILFSYQNEKFDWNAAHAISTAIQHGFQDKIQPGIENLYSLTSNHVKEIAHE